MSTKQRQRIENQPQVTVAAQTNSAQLTYAWFVTLAVFYAGVFYFYFWGNFGGALAGG